jgi:hypothetical protein
MQTHAQLLVRQLTAEDSAELLRTHHVGRIAFSWRDHVDVEPISYVYDDGAIYGRTSEGAKMLTLRHSPWVAFEVDEVRGPYDWRSAVAHGTVYVLRPDGTRAARRAYEHALELLRTLEPAALTDHDPAPDRRILFQISVDHVTGRAASLAERAPAPWDGGRA